MAAFFYEATVESVVGNKATPIQPGTVWLNVGNITSLEYYDADSTKVYFQPNDGGLGMKNPIALICTGTLATIATAIEAAASTDNEYRTFTVTKQNNTTAIMTLAVKDISYMFPYRALTGVTTLRYVSGGSKPLWLLVELASANVPDLFDSAYAGSTGLNGVPFEEDEESW